MKTTKDTMKKKKAKNKRKKYNSCPLVYCWGCGWTNPVQYTYSETCMQCLRASHLCSVFMGNNVRCHNGICPHCHPRKAKKAAAEEQSKREVWIESLGGQEQYRAAYDYLDKELGWDEWTQEHEMDKAIEDYLTKEPCHQLPQQPADS